MVDDGISTQEIVRELKEILVRNLDLDLELDAISDDVSLLEDGLALDSVVIVELITHVENRFGFQFDDQNLRSENFANLTVLAELIANERATAKPAA